MPIYIYRAVTKSGQIVRNRVEESNKFALLKRIKKNDLLPINIVQINSKLSKIKVRQKKNMESSDSILKRIRTDEETKKEKIKTNKIKTKIKDILFKSNKINQRDIVVFTQNFYLLKKANFNNIQALSTIIESTENHSLKAIIEDILMGVEAGENIYTTMEYYTGIFSPIYINIIKVGELSRIFCKSIRTSN